MKAVGGMSAATWRRAGNARLAAALRLDLRHERRQVDRQRPSKPVDVDRAHVTAPALDVANHEGEVTRLVGLPNAPPSERGRWPDASGRTRTG